MQDDDIESNLQTNPRTNNNELSASQARNMVRQSVKISARENAIMALLHSLILQSYIIKYCHTSFYFVYNWHFCGLFVSEAGIFLYFERITPVRQSDKVTNQ